MAPRGVEDATFVAGFDFDMVMLQKSFRRPQIIKTDPCHAATTEETAEVIPHMTKRYS
jgi:hypothetical protein